MDDCGDGFDQPDIQETELEKIKELMIEHMHEGGKEASALLAQADEVEESVAENMVKNHWQVRVSRYLSWAVDGGIMGAKFTLDKMVESITYLKEASFKKVEKALK